LRGESDLRGFAMGGWWGIGGGAVLVGFGGGVGFVGGALGGEGWGFFCGVWGGFSWSAPFSSSSLVSCHIIMVVSLFLVFWFP